MASPANMRESRSRLFPTLLLLTLATAELALGIYALACHVLWPAGPDCFATAGWLLVLSATATSYVARRVGLEPTRSSGLGKRWFARSMLIGAAAAYGGGLLLAPLPGTPCAFAAALAVWCNLLLLPLTANPQTLERWRKIIESRAPKRIGLAVYHALLALTVAEASLRGYQLGRHWEPFALAAADDTLAAEDRGARRANLPGVLRVAFVTGLTAGQAPGATDWHTPDEFCGALELRHFDAGLAGDQRTNGWRRELTEFEPNLVLGIVALEQGLPRSTAAAGCFDWRSLQVLRLMRDGLGLPAAAANHATSADPAFEGALAGLAVCHTPLDGAAKARWQQTFAGLDAFVGGCQSLDARVALVVVPAGFQVNRVLCDVLRRRAGYEPQELDLALPQRRLAAYAAERRLELLDLLPYLQASDEPVFRHRDATWNEQGRLVAARALRGWIESQYSGVAARAQLTDGG